MSTHRRRLPSSDFLVTVAYDNCTRRWSQSFGQNLYQDRDTPNLNMFRTFVVYYTYN